MKILLIIPTLQQGGAERVMSELANEFASRNHQIQLILLAESKDFFKINSTIQIHRLEFRNKNILQKAFAEFQNFVKLRKLLKKESPDVVLSFMTKYNVLTILASRLLKLRVFVSDRSNPKKTLPKYINLLRKITYKYASGIIAQTSLAKELLEVVSQNKNIKIIPNPIKQVKLYPKTKREKIILNVGRLVPEKWQKYLLEAFIKIEAPDWKLVILGEGPLRKELESQAEALNIKDKLYMPGEVSNVDEWLVRASIFAFPSISEGFPNALVEAMAAGLPCVSFDCDAGPRDIIMDGENGFLISLFDQAQFIQKLKLLINNKDLRVSFGNKSIATSTNYNINGVSKNFLKILTQ